MCQALGTLQCVTDKIPTLRKLSPLGVGEAGRQSINRIHGMADVPECSGGKRKPFVGSFLACLGICGQVHIVHPHPPCPVLLFENYLSYFLCSYSPI